MVRIPCGCCDFELDTYECSVEQQQLCSNLCKTILSGPRTAAAVQQPRTSSRFSVFSVSLSHLLPVSWIAFANCADHELRVIGKSPPQA